jgi:uncharacterized protein involved in exopolysaccharide biosynthesis
MAVVSDLHARPSPVPPPAQQAPEELKLYDHLKVLYRYRLVILIVPILTGVLAYYAVRQLPPQYESAARLIVGSSRLENESADPRMISTMTATLRNVAVAESVVQKFKLDQPPHQISPQRFLLYHLGVENVRETRIIEVKVSIGNARMAADLANAYAAGVVDLTTKLVQADGLSARDLVRRQVEAAKREMEIAGRARDEYRRVAQIEVVRKEVDTLLDQRGTLNKLLIDIETERARLSQAEAQLTSRSRIETLRRSIDSDPALMETARRVASGNELLAVELKQEIVNSVHEQLESEAVESRTRLAGLEATRDRLTNVNRAGAPDLQRLKDLYEREATLARLQTDFEIARTAYIGASGRLLDAELLVATRSPQLQILDRAVPAEQQTFPRPVRTAALAAIAAFVFAAIGSLLWHYKPWRALAA